MNLDNLKNKVKLNSDSILELKAMIKKYYDVDIEINDYNVNDITDVNELKEIIKKQKLEIKGLNIMSRIEAQKFENKLNKKIEELKEQEQDKEFSNFYRNGIIIINDVGVSVDKFYIKEIENDVGEIKYNFVCADKRMDRKFFGSIDDKDYKVKNIYRLKDSKVFYDMYLDKSVYSDGKIIINNKEKLVSFISYIKRWDKEKHRMVAELMA